jgi:gliding motility associated protien GldN
MRKLILIHSLLIIAVSAVFAQNEVLPFFEKSGKVAIQTEEMKSLSDTIAIVNHRRDDIVWSRIVYRIIDMREKQNSQLYFPITPTVKYKNLLRVILEATVNDTLKGYEKKDEDIQPAWNKAPICKEKFADFFIDCDWDSAEQKIRKTPLVKNDPITNKPIVNDYAFGSYSANSLKYVIQEIVFFNKHYSKMYSKVIAIAPYFSKNEINLTKLNTGGIAKTDEGIWNYFQSSVVCWFLYDELRPYIVKELIVPNGNENQRMTFDDFFSQRLFYSYLLGDSNMFDKMLLQTYSDPVSIRREQQRIEYELMNIEQDIWEQ